MSVNLFRGRALIKGYKTMQQVIASRVIIVTASVIGEIVTQWGSREFVGKQVDFIQEQDLPERGKSKREVTELKWKNILWMF